MTGSTPADFYERRIPSQFNRALARNPNDAALHGGLGLALTRAGRTQLAIPEFEKCLLLDPERALFEKAKRPARFSRVAV